MKSRLLGLLFLAMAALILAAPRVQAEPTNHRVINASTPGQPVDLEKFVVKGKTNIFDFYSKYCPPCMRISPALELLAQRNPNVQINKVDINRPEIRGIDWSGPCAKAYNLHSIPHFVIYDASGKKVAEGQEARARVIELFKQANIN